MIITSTTDSKEAVLAATGKLDEKQVQKPVESIEASDAGKKLAEKPAESEPAKIEQEIDASDEDEVDEVESKEGEKPKKKGGYKRKVEKANAKIAALEKDVELWRQEALRAKPAETAKEQKVEAKVEAAGKPKASDFEKHDEYVEALADWTAEQKFAKRESDQKQTALKQEFDKKNETLGTKIQEAKKVHTDWDDVLEEVSDVKPSFTVQHSVLESDVGAELIYELAKNREEYERICKMNSSDAFRAIGKIEARIEARLQSAKDSSKDEPKITKAPKPVNPVGAKAGAGQKDPGEMSLPEYKKWREQGGGARA